MYFSLKRIYNTVLKFFLESIFMLLHIFVFFLLYISFINCFAYGVQRLEWF